MITSVQTHLYLKDTTCWSSECFSLNCQLLLNFIGDDCFQPEKPMSILMLENDLRTKVDNLKLVKYMFFLIRRYHLTFTHLCFSGQ